jgi:hypothetical protein
MVGKKGNKLKSFKWVIRCQTTTLFIMWIKVNYLPIAKILKSVELNMSYHVVTSLICNWNIFEKSIPIKKFQIPSRRSIHFLYNFMLENK